MITARAVFAVITALLPILSGAALAAQAKPADSGARVVTYAGVTLGRPAGLRLDPQRSLSITEDSGCEFNRVVGIAVQSKGNLVVANSGNFELCVFSPSGKLIKRVGRSGGGPGEYRSIESIDLMRGDSLLIRDGLLRRLTVLSGEGTFARTIALTPPIDTLGYASLIAPLRDGTLLVGYSEVRTFKPQPEPAYFTIQLFRYDTKGTLLERLGRFLSTERFVQEVPLEMGRIAYWARAFGRQLSLIPFGDGFIAGDGTDFTLRDYSPKGVVTTIHKIDLPVRGITTQEIAAYKQSETARAKPPWVSVTEKRVAEMPYPANYPAFRRLLPDPNGRIWLEVYPAIGADVSDWIVLDTMSRRSSLVRLPARFHPHALSRAALCGVSRDELDLESIRCYPVR